MPTGPSVAREDLGQPGVVRQPAPAMPAHDCEGIQQRQRPVRTAEDMGMNRDIETPEWRTQPRPTCHDLLQCAGERQ